MSDAAKALTALGLFFAVIGGLLAFLFLYRPGLSACDEAIKATLKAPATYHRVNATGNENDGFYLIDYDAENSFGVPLRASGICNVTNGQARWLEMPQPSDGPD